MNHFLIQTIKIQKGAKQNENSHKSNVKKKKGTDARLMVYNIQIFSF